AYGWGSQWAAFNDIVMRESAWNPFARNPSSGAYGIPQALPPGKMASAGADWATNPFTQLRWMMSYIRPRWGSPAAADRNEQLFHWYDRGGWLPPGLSLAYNGTGRPEMVVPGGRGGGATVVVQGAPAVAAGAPDPEARPRTPQHATAAIKGRTAPYPARA